MYCLTLGKKWKKVELLRFGKCWKKWQGNNGDCVCFARNKCEVYIQKTRICIVIKSSYWPFCPKVHQFLYVFINIRRCFNTPPKLPLFINQYNDLSICITGIMKIQMRQSTVISNQWQSKLFKTGLFFIH